MNAKHAISALSVTAVVLLAGGCATKNHEDLKQEAIARWQGVRAGMVLQVADEQFRKGRFEAARRTLEQALKTQTDDPKLHVLLARILFELQESENAERHLTQAHNLAPDLPEVYYVRGIFAQSASQWAQAHEAYQTAYDKVPDSEDYLCALVEAKLALGRPEEAAEFITAKFEDFPRSSRLRIAAGDCCLVRGDLAWAERFYQEACDMDPFNVEAKEGLIQTLYLEGKYRQTAHLLDRHIDTYWPERIDFRIMLGHCHLAEGHYEMAIRAYERCLTQCPKRPGLRIHLARAQLLNGQDEQARRELEKVSEDGRDTPQFWELMGHVCLRDGQLLLAQQAYQRAIEYGADRERIADFLAVVQQSARERLAKANINRRTAEEK